MDRPLRQSSRTARPREHAHGWHRVGDRPDAPASTAALVRTPHSRVWVSWVLALLVGAATVTGVERVRACNRVLQLGAEVTALTAEHAELQELKRRLQAERAYLRHPDRIQEVAKQQLGFVAVDPRRIQTIEIAESKR